MGIWTDIAQWVGPTPNRGGAITQHLYVIEHIADGTFAGTIAWQKKDSSNVSSHFIVAKDGRIAQMVDTNQQAWTQIQGNPYSIAVENEGYSGDALTPQQVTASAKLLERAHREHGIPLQVTNRVGTPGLGHHSMGYESGVNWGHQFCPGEKIKAQKPSIVTLAQQIAGGGGTNKEATMFLISVAGSPAIFVSSSQTYRQVPNVRALQLYQSMGVPSVAVNSVQELNDVGGTAAGTVQIHLSPEDLQAVEDAAKAGAAEGAPGPSIDEIEAVVDKQVDQGAHPDDDIAHPL